MHTIYFPDLARVASHPVPTSPGVAAPIPLLIVGDEAHHATRVKRMIVGDPVRLVDGKGAHTNAKIHEIRKSGKDWVLELRADAIRNTPPSSPILEACVASPKGDHLSDMIDGLSQVGVTRWRSLSSSRAIVEPRDGKLERLSRTCFEAMKQCGRLYSLEVGTSINFADALTPDPIPGRRALILADSSGAPLAQLQPTQAAAIKAATFVRLLVGPEGGFSPEELNQAREAGAAIVCFGKHTMRIETAAVVAAAMVDAFVARA